MKAPYHSSLRVYGIFITVAFICLGGMVGGFILQNVMLFWVSLLLFSTFGIVRILIILRALRTTNLSQEKRNLGLLKEQSQLQTLINSLGEAVLAVNTKGEITIYNAAALELIDSHNELGGQSLTTAFALTDSKQQPVDITTSVVREGKIAIRDDVFLRRDKLGSIPLYIITTPINEQGEIVGAIILARDITQQKSLQAQKDEFLSVVSHELRTPVAIVEADISTVLLPGYTDLPDKAKKLLTSASQNITYLSGLLQDISDLSHAERHVLDVELKSVNSQAIAKELAQDFSGRALKASLEFKADISESTTSIVSSTQRIEEILVNFLTNAIKYSSGVGKAVTLKLGPSKLYEGGVRYEVSDQGLGISEEDQAKLFSKFFRSSSDSVQAIKGTGMGLYITSQQARKIGGEITMQSTLGKGSTFALDLPARVPAELVDKTSS